MVAMLLPGWSGWLFSGLIPNRFSQVFKFLQLFYHFLGGSESLFSYKHNFHIP